LPFGHEKKREERAVESKRRENRNNRASSPEKPPAEPIRTWKRLGKSSDEKKRRKGRRGATIEQKRITVWHFVSSDDASSHTSERPRNKDGDCTL
jgi:hypothetical protein